MKFSLKKTVFAIFVLLITVCIFTACDDPSQPPKHSITFDVDGETYHTLETSGSEVIALPADPQKTGYTFSGWYFDDGEWTQPFTKNTYRLDPLSSDTCVYAKWTINEYTVHVEGFETSQGRVNGQGKYNFGENVALSFVLKNDNVFVGWYRNNTFLSDTTSYSFTMPADDVNITAKCCKVAVEKNLPNAGVTTELNDIYAVGDVTTLTATTYLGYTWLGWFNGEEKLSGDLNYNLTIPDKNTTITAKWKVNNEMSNYTFDSTQELCTITGVIDKSISEISIPDYVNEIGGKAFENCYNLIHVTVPETVTTVNFGAFKNCTSLTSITLPFLGMTADNKLYANIGYIFGVRNPLSNDTVVPASLTDIVITGGIVASRAFWGCPNIRRVKLPDNLMSIPSEAFCYCSNLESVEIPSSVTFIDSYAFQNCANLTTLKYNGTKTQWNNISTNVSWNKNTGAYIVECSNGNLDKDGNEI